MKATELRIGNLVKGKEMNVYWTVEAVDSNSIFSYGKWRSLDAFEPIPLTEEWLVKFGFEKYKFDHKENQYRYKERLIVSRDGNFVDYGSSVILKHLHQLQNLYHALTGEELTLKNQ
jgi:hypothetical protein